MKLKEFLRLFPDIKLTNTQIAFCLFLEQEGQVFCVDFGYGNAVAKASELIDDELASMWREEEITWMEMPPS